MRCWQQDLPCGCSDKVHGRALQPPQGGATGPVLRGRGWAALGSPAVPVL